MGKGSWCNAAVDIIFVCCIGESGWWDYSHLFELLIYKDRGSHSLQVNPIQHKRSLAFLNYFVTHTAGFLNRYNNSLLEDIISHALSRTFVNCKWSYYCIVIQIFQCMRGKAQSSGATIRTTRGHDAYFWEQGNIFIVYPPRLCSRIYVFQAFC